MSIVHQPADNFTFQVKTSQAFFLIPCKMNGYSILDVLIIWIRMLPCSHVLDKVVEKKIYVVDDFSLNIVGCGDVPYRHGNSFHIYHVSNLSANLLSFSQLTQIGKIVEF
jgi:hypothetical protein